MYKDEKPSDIQNLILFIVELFANVSIFTLNLHQSI